LFVFRFTHRAAAGDLVIAMTPAGRVVKFFCPQDNGYVQLCGANPPYKDRCWRRENVRIQGVIVRVECAGGRILEGEQLRAAGPLEWSEIISTEDEGNIL
jgi:hypothetical protein